MRLERDNALVRSLPLTGLDQAASRQLLASRGITAVTPAEASLTQYYSGNPLALKLAADEIHTLFFGDVESFLATEAFIFGNVRHLLDQQFARLSTLEQEILFWLAITRETVAVPTLQTLLLQPPAGRHLLEALQALHRRSLLERRSNGFTLQNVITEYLTDRLVERAISELEQAELDWLHRLPLMQAQTKEHVRQSQIRLILHMVAERMVQRLTLDGLTARFRGILDSLRQTHAGAASYAGGTLLNLLLDLGVDLHGFDFSRLCVWHADLRNRTLPGVNFAGADLTHCTFTQTFARIEAVAISPDGQWLAAGGDGGEVRLFRLADGQPVTVLAGHTNSLSALAFSPDGSLLASTADDCTLRIWDVEHGRAIHTLDGCNPLRGVAFSPNGSRVASCGHDSTVQLWDVTNGLLLCRLEAHNLRVDAVAFHPDGKLLASAGHDGYVHLWDVGKVHESAQDDASSRPSSAALLVKTLHGEQHIPILSAAFSHDGSLLAVGAGSGIITIWDTQDFNTCYILDADTRWIWALAFRADDRLLVSSSANSIRLWDLSTRQCVNLLTGFQDTVWSLALTPDGKMLASGSEDGTICLWDIATPQRSTLSQTLRGYLRSAERLAWSGCGRWVATGDVRGSARLWDLTERIPRCQHVMLGHISVRAVAFSPDSKVLATGGEDLQYGVRLWDVRNGTCLAELSAQAKDVQCVSFAANGTRLVSGGRDGVLQAWDTSDLNDIRALRTWQGHNRHISNMVAAANDKWLATCGHDQFIHIWDLATNELIATLPGFGDNECLAINQDCTLLACAGRDLAIALWDLTDLQAKDPVRHLASHTNHVHSCAFSPDGSLLVSGSLDRSLRLWDVTTGEQVAVLGHHPQFVLDVSFSPHGERVASVGKEGSLRFWDVETGECLHVLHAPGPYAGMNITGATGISEAQRSALMALGAVED